MKKQGIIGLAVLLVAVLLTACFPEGGGFGHGDRMPRPEFAGSPMATPIRAQEMEE